jgi:hypothetical protein
MATRKVTVTLPDDVTARLEDGDIDNVSAYVTAAVRAQIRREAILGLLAALEAEGDRPLTDADLAEFRQLVGEDEPAAAA